MPLSQFEVNLLSGMLAKSIPALQFQGDRLDGIRFGALAALKLLAPTVTLDAKFTPKEKGPEQAAPAPEPPKE